MKLKLLALLTFSLIASETKSVNLNNIANDGIELGSIIAIAPQFVNRVMLPMIAKLDELYETHNWTKLEEIRNRHNMLTKIGLGIIAASLIAKAYVKYYKKPNPTTSN